jgi:hypothetical protein
MDERTQTKWRRGTFSNSDNQQYKFVFRCEKEHVGTNLYKRYEGVFIDRRYGYCSLLNGLSLTIILVVKCGVSFCRPPPLACPCWARAKPKKPYLQVRSLRCPREEVIASLFPASVSSPSSSVSHTLAPCRVSTIPVGYSLGNGYFSPSFDNIATVASI